MSEQALKRIFPDLAVHTVTLSPTLFLRLGDGSVSARSRLSQVAGIGISTDLSGFGGAICHPCVNLEVENEDEHWNADFHAYGEWWGSEPPLIASCRTASGRSTSRTPQVTACVDQAATASNATRLRISLLNSTPMRWIGRPEARYLSA